MSRSTGGGGIDYEEWLRLERALEKVDALEAHAQMTSVFGTVNQGEGGVGLTDLPDTNACTYALDGRLASPWPIGDFVLSAITEIELLAKPGMTAEEEQSVRSEAARIRRDHGLKLPDAIIAATALVMRAELLSNDRQFARVPGLVVMALALKP